MKIQLPFPGTIQLIYRDRDLSQLLVVSGQHTGKMAEDTIDQAISLAHLDFQESVTKELRIHGYHSYAEEFGDLSIYGSDANAINELLEKDISFKEGLHPRFPIKKGEVVWCTRNEMARTVEDFLARRTRLILKDAKASIESALPVAEIMAKELNRDSNWVKDQVKGFTAIAKNYIVN